MSSIAVNTITDASGGATATINGYTPTVSNMGGKNRIINGDMRIDQRNAGAAVTITDSAPYTLDRWWAYSAPTSKFTLQQNAGSVTAPIGFKNYLGGTSSSAYSVNAADQFVIAQSVEGYNIADLGWGTANAKTVTLSFQVYSSLTGTFAGSIQNGTNARSYVFSYSIPVANTWTTINVTIAGDTTGTWASTNGAGLLVLFSLGAGSNYNATAGVWSAGNFKSVTGATSVVGTSGATFYITGVQLEAGSVATPFEHRQYGQELALCQRYFQNAKYGINAVAFGVSNSYSSGNRVFLCGGSEFKVDMRTQPTITLYSSQTRTLGQVSGYSSGTDYVVSSIASPDNRRIGMYLQLASSPPVFDTLAFYFDASAEL